MKEGTIIVGYGGHAYVAIDILLQNNVIVIGYCDRSKKEKDPFALQYLGSEHSLSEHLINDNSFFIAVGSNDIRFQVYEYLVQRKSSFVSAMHPKSIIAPGVLMGEAVMVAAGVCINSLASIGNGTICNTNCSIDHECRIGDFSHIAPGAVLCGNVTVGNHSFIGANAVIKEGVVVGDNVTIGAGSVVLKDVPSGAIMFGNPAKCR